MGFKIQFLCAHVLMEPGHSESSGPARKGVVILNHVDPAVEIFPWLKSAFILVEVRGWHGMNEGRQADIKLVEDFSTLEETRAAFPEATAVDAGFGDFVDTDAFRPLPAEPDFDVIQIASWTRRKRLELFVETAARLPHLKFVHFGHYEESCSAAETDYYQECADRANRLGANITFPFTPADWLRNVAPTSKEDINRWINRAKIGLLTTSSEGHNRFKMECFAANRPVVGCNDTCAPTWKHFTPATGRLVAPNPAELARAVQSVLDQRGLFSPRDYVLQTTGRRRSVELLKQALAVYCQRTREPYRFDDIDWDGRNASLAWGYDAIGLLQRYGPPQRTVEAVYHA